MKKIRKIRILDLWYLYIRCISREYTPVKFVYDGHRVKVKVTGAMCSCYLVAYIQLGLSAKSRQASYLANSNAATNYRGRNDERSEGLNHWCSLSFKFGAKAAKTRFFVDRQLIQRLDTLNLLTKLTIFVLRPCQTGWIANCLFTLSTFRYTQFFVQFSGAITI